VPKQFLPLVAGRSTFAMTLERVADRAIFERPLIVANSEHRYLVAEALRAARLDGEVLLEPMRRDSAMAIAAAAEMIAARDANAVLLVLPADHLIRDSAGFLATARQALPAANEGRIVTFGIRPDTPATQYGYIRKGDLLPGLPGVSAVAEFAEKPDVARATGYVASGYLWNSGNFMMRASLAVAEIGRHQPAIAAAARAAVAGIAAGPGYLRLPREPYDTAPAISFDYAVMEKTDLAALVEAQFDWQDLGGWETLSAIATPDRSGNTTTGEVVLNDTRGCHVHAGSGVVALLGVDNLVVATSGDAVLVAARDRIGAVKDLVATLPQTRSDAGAGGSPAVRPWGYYQVIGGGDFYQVKRLVVEPGARLSLQRHSHRAEHWVVVNGIADVTVDKETSRLGVNQSTFIPLGAVHRLANPGEELLTVIEVQYGDYLGEDDIERFADDYDRRV
jgi:mannose-1-phosphate guanylyltransferase/mannose-6-phosphate isomerase